jgi:D-alanyl-D-alanine carboxypeptidase (penicillin-binding protein 5/6)
VKFLAFFWAIPGIMFAGLSCDVPAPIGLLMNGENGKVLWSKNGEKACYPASTTKLATALYVLHKLEGDLGKKTTASYDALAIVSSALRRSSGKHPSYRLEFGGTHIGIKVGEELDFETLLHGLMLSSGNDAANVLAEAVSGSVSQFMEELNAFLEGIGCKNTKFTNPHGMPDPLHMTTALDLALMAKSALKNPLFRQIVSSKSYERKETNKQPASLLTQHNALLKPGKYFYPHAIGVKTGYTVQAGYTLVAAAEKGDRKLIAVLANCEDLAKRYRSAIQLFETAFNEEKVTRKLLSKEHDLFHRKIEGGKAPLEACLSRDVTVSFYPSEGQEFHPQLFWLELPLPIRQGDEVGLIQLLDQSGALQDTISIVAAKGVEATFSYKFNQQVTAVRLLLKQHKSYLGYAFAFVLFGICFRRFRKVKKTSA